MSTTCFIRSNNTVQNDMYFLFQIIIMNFMFFWKLLVDSYSIEINEIAQTEIIRHLF